MARMPYVDPDKAHWLAKEILARRNNRNIHRMLGHCCACCSTHQTADSIGF